MKVSAPHMVRQPRPRGYPWPVSAEWKRRVLERMAELEPPMNKTALAIRIGVSTAAVAQLFRTKGKIQTTTRLKPAIHDALGWPPPAMQDDLHPVGVLDENKQFLDENWATLSEEDRTWLVSTMRRLTEIKRK